MHLTRQLSLRPAGSLLWSAAGASATSEQLAALLKERSEQIVGFTGKRVALVGGKNIDLAVALAALDGIAESILLVPSDTSPEDASALCEMAACDRFVGLGASFFPSLPCKPFPFGFSDVASAIGAAETDAAEETPTETRWVIPTSGTTGTPKLVSHTLSSLARSVKSDKTVGEVIRWGLLYDLRRFAGLQVYLQAFCGGSALIIPDDPSAPSSALSELAANDCNALSCTPSMWRKFLMDPRLASLNLRWVSMGGEIADDHLLSTLKKMFPTARIAHIYASTEAGVGFSVTDGLAGFPASYLDVPPKGIRLRVDADGFLHLRPDRAHQHYIGRNEALSDKEGWINTGDLVVCSGGRYRFLGRANGAINVGGNKVQPHEVEQVILGVKGVAEAVVLPKKNPILGALVQAKVVPKAGFDPDMLEQAIHAACATALDDFKRPAIVTMVPMIALGASGKVKR